MLQENVQHHSGLPATPPAVAICSHLFPRQETCLMCVLRPELCFVSGLRQLSGIERAWIQTGNMHLTKLY